ncbi:hypothetical protein [Carp edema virus]|nr:hypothetical protein [Carp edema virus]
MSVLFLVILFYTFFSLIECTEVVDLSKQNYTKQHKVLEEHLMLNFDSQKDVFSYYISESVFEFLSMTQMFITFFNITTYPSSIININYNSIISESFSNIAYLLVRIKFNKILNAKGIHFIRNTFMFTGFFELLIQNNKVKEIVVERNFLLTGKKFKQLHIINNNVSQLVITKNNFGNIDFVINANHINKLIIMNNIIDKIVCNDNFIGSYHIYKNLNTKGGQTIIGDNCFTKNNPDEPIKIDVYTKGDKIVIGVGVTLILIMTACIIFLLVLIKRTYNTDEYNFLDFELNKIDFLS